jgi:hypothetical protein
MDVNSAFYRDKIPSFVDEEFANFSIGKGKKNVKVNVANVLLPFTLIGKAKRTRAKEAAAKAEKAKEIADAKALELENAKTDAEIARAKAEIKIAKSDEIKATANAIAAEADAKIAETNVKKIEADIKKEEVAVATESAVASDVFIADKTKSNKNLMYIGGGIAVLVVAYLLFKKK